MLKSAGSRTPTDGGERNRLLRALPSVELRSLRPDLEHIELAHGDVMHAPRELIPFALFPEAGVASVLAVDNAGVGVEVVSVGNEGMVGMSLVHDIASSPHLCIIQVAGHGKRIRGPALARQLPDLPVLQRLLGRYATAMFNEAAQTILCNRRHSIDERCARWLLMTDDRVSGEDFALKQEFLSYMLAARRPSVSRAAARLQRDGLIRYSRGVIRVLDRAGLEAAACECYTITRAANDRLHD